jgi:predicted phage baseplate assembly protein
MSSSYDPSLHGLHPSGCCEGLSTSTPLVVANRPGLQAVAYRAGTWRDFYQTMLARLSAGEDEVLDRLKTRENDDFSIALIDAWSVVSDVLTFYQERYANESYLRTASERRSLVELGRLIGYQPSPGVAAEAWLAFTVDEDAGKALVEKGTRVQSLPRDGKLPQTFEVVEELEADANWNSLTPRRCKPHPLSDAVGKPFDSYLLDGTDTRLAVGDGVLIGDDGMAATFFRLVAEVTADTKAGHTTVRLEEPPPLEFSFLIVPVQMLIPPIPMILPSAAAAQVLSEINPKIVGAELRAKALIRDFKIAHLFANLKVAETPPKGLMAFRKRASIFGHNAPQLEMMPGATQTAFKDKWADDTNLGNFPGANFPPGARSKVFLDASYSDITKDSWVVLQDGGAWKNLKVRAVSEQSLAKFAVSGKSTRLTVDKEDLDRFSVRGTTVHAQSEVLTLARQPIRADVSGAFIDLDRLVDGIQPGRSVIVCGELADNRGNNACERVVVDDVDHFLGADNYTRLRFKRALGNSYVRDTVTIHGNVARASHGESVAGEVLGSGNATQPFQRFALKRTPLTHLSAPSASGTESTLELRVDGVRWHESANLESLASQDRKYTVRADSEGKSHVLFGDGRHGARVPSGSENVVADYRFGIGAEGNVDAESLTLMARRPAGVAGVSNPMAASGGADPEDRDEMRGNAPLDVKTLARVVSLADYASFAGAFAGIGKSLATWTWTGEVRGVFITIAGPGGRLIPADAAVIGNLAAALRRAGDPLVPLRIGCYRRAYFQFGGGVTIHHDHETETVLEAIDNEVREAFSFTRRDFGQPVTVGEIAALVQRVPGVVAFHIESLHRTGRAAVIHPRLMAAVPEPGPVSEVEAAELLLLDPRPLRLGVVR